MVVTGRAHCSILLYIDIYINFKKKLYCRVKNSNLKFLGRCDLSSEKLSDDGSQQPRNSLMTGRNDLETLS